MADVVSTLRGWSATSASNLPANTTTIGAGLDDNLQEIQGVIRKYLASPGTNMASATTVDLSTADGFYIQITGTTTITGLGTESAGIHYLLRFAGALTFTHNATTLILPGNASITTAAGDLALMISEGSGNWRCVNYQRLAGIATADIAAAQITAAKLDGAQSGSAPIYGARAWARFTSATGTKAGSGNVGTITRNSIGNWTVNFTTAMADTNYCVVATPGNSNAAMVIADTHATGTFRLLAFDQTNAAVDPTLIQFVVYR